MTTLKNQRELLKTQRESQKKKTIISAIAVVAVVAIALVLLYFVPRREVDGPSAGDPDAPVKVAQFSNFTCSHCRTYTLESEASTTSSRKMIPAKLPKQPIVPENKTSFGITKKWCSKTSVMQGRSLMRVYEIMLAMLV